MTRTVAFIVALAAIVLTGQAQGQGRDEGCALVAGRDAQGNLQFEPSFEKAHPDEAWHDAAYKLVRVRQLQYVDGRPAWDGAVAFAVYKNLSGQEQYHPQPGTSALDAISSALSYVGSMSPLRDYGVYVRWVRCTSSAPFDPRDQKQLEQLTWNPNVSRFYAGYQIVVQSLTGNTGAIHVVAPGGAPPPAPTPAPSAWGTPPVGCWQRYDYANRPDGNAVYIGPLSTNSVGTPTYEGRHLALSAGQVANQRQVNTWAISLIPRSDGRYDGSYETVTGSHQMTGFDVTADTIDTHIRSQNQKFTWRRVQCPQGGAR